MNYITLRTLIWLAQVQTKFTHHFNNRMSSWGLLAGTWHQEEVVSFVLLFVVWRELRKGLFVLSMTDYNWNTWLLFLFVQWQCLAQRMGVSALFDSDSWLIMHFVSFTWTTWYTFWMLSRLMIEDIKGEKMTTMLEIKILVCSGVAVVYRFHGIMS